MNKLNFVFIGLQRIDTGRESTATGLAKELAKRHRVLYINPPIDRNTFIRRRQHDKFVDAHIDLIERKDTVSNFIKKDDNFWVLNPLSVLESINWIPFTSVFRILNRWNNIVLSREIKRRLKEIDFTDFVLINDKEIFKGFYLKALLRPLAYVYLDRDFTLGVPYWKRHGTVLEPELMGNADLVFCNSPGFRNRALQYNPRTYFIGNGCDLSLFDASRTFDCPADLAALKSRLVVGYFGAILSMRLDVSLLIELAKARTEWHFVMVGPEDDIFRQSELHRLPNVHFLGRKDSGMAPAYIQHFDVCINPQIVNEITEHNYPLKIDEYLAMGKPVVAIETNTMREVFKETVNLVRNSQQFVEAIQEEMEKDSKHLAAKRIAFASTHSWTNFANNILVIMSEYLKIRHLISVVDSKKS